METRLNKLVLTMKPTGFTGPVRGFVQVDSQAPMTFEVNEQIADSAVRAFAGDWPLGHHYFNMTVIGEVPPAATLEVTGAEINGTPIPMVAFTMHGAGQSPPVGFEIREHAFNVAAQIERLHQKVSVLMICCTNVMGCFMGLLSTLPDSDRGKVAEAIIGTYKAVNGVLGLEPLNLPDDWYERLLAAAPALTTPEAVAAALAEAWETPADAAPKPPVEPPAPEPEPVPAAA